MAKPVFMPKFGFVQEESTIVQWLKKEGDVVEKGDPIVEVTTDKINMEVEAPADGILGGIRYHAGDEVPVTEVIAYILAEGEEVPQVDEPVPAAAEPSVGEGAPVGTQPESPVAATPVARRLADAESVDLAQVVGSGAGGKITREDVAQFVAARGRPTMGDGKLRATPAARRAARERGLDLATVVGSGPQGRIQRADVERSAAMSIPIVAGEPTIIPLEGMRRTIAERLQAAYQQAPHITFTLDIDMSKAIAFRDYANERVPEGQPRVSMTAVLVRACAWALRQHPLLNSYLRGERIYVMPDVNVGVAVALEEGLIVPVVRDADRKGLVQIGAEVVDLSTRARANRLRPEDVADGTFTVSNLGMFGIDRFTAILNPPQVGILAVGRIAKRFVPDEDDQPVARPMMTVTLVVDHRVVDGALAAQFVATLRDALEEPTRLLL